MRRPLLRLGLPHPAVSSSSSLPEGRTEASTLLHFQPLAHPSPALDVLGRSPSAPLVHLFAGSAECLLCAHAVETVGSRQTWLMCSKSLWSRPAGEADFNQIITCMNVT